MINKLRHINRAIFHTWRIKPSLRRSSNRIDPLEFFLSQAYGRIVKLQRYRITARINNHMVAVKLPEEWICTMKAELGLDRRNWAHLTVDYGDKEPPSISEIERMKDDFFGKDANYAIRLRPTSIFVFHCIGDFYLPGP